MATEKYHEEKRLKQQCKSENDMITQCLLVIFPVFPLIQLLLVKDTRKNYSAA